MSRFGGCKVTLEWGVCPCLMALCSPFTEVYIGYVLIYCMGQRCLCYGRRTISLLADHIQNSMHWCSKPNAGTVQKSSDSRTLYLSLTSFSPLPVVKPFHDGFHIGFPSNPCITHTKLHKSHKNTSFRRNQQVATANKGLRHTRNF